MGRTGGRAPARAAPLVTPSARLLAPGRLLAHSGNVGDSKPSIDDLDRAMGFILAAVADGYVGVEQARKLIRAKGVIPAAKQIRKATREDRHRAKKTQQAQKQQKEKKSRR